MLTTFVALVMPVLVLLMAAALNVSHGVHSKIQLQNAADRAAYAGAAKQAAIMNDMGTKNREIHGIFEALKKNILPNSSNGERDVTQKVTDAQIRIRAAYREMEEWNSDANQKAEAVSRSVAEENYAAATPHSNAPQVMLTLLSGAERDQRQHLRPEHHNMVGGLIWEPASHDQTDNVVQSYYVKDPNQEVRWQVELSAPTPRGVMSGFFVRPELHAVSAAQPHGSSIRDCGLNPECPSYEVSFVPYSD